MEKDGDTQKTEKRFWIDYEAIEKFNFVIAVFAAVSSIAIDWAVLDRQEHTRRKPTGFCIRCQG